MSLFTRSSRALRTQPPALPVLLAALLALAGCAPATRVVLLPQPHGAASAVEVQTGQAQTRLDTPYQTAAVSPRGGVERGQTDADAVRQRYGRVLAATPAAPLHFTLHFVQGASALTPESQQQLEQVLTQATQRPGGEIIVTGHTDRAGDQALNDRLSLERALGLRELLIQRGFPAQRVQAVGRGEREPAVPTDDDVAEPRNRRAEITVR